MAEENISPTNQPMEETIPQAIIPETPIQTPKAPPTIQPNPQPDSVIPGSKKSLVKKLLLVVVLILIIAGLIVAGMRFYKSWQIKQRDSQRKTDIQTLQKALETYKTKTQDQKAYPAAITDNTMVKTKVMDKLPTDPLNKGQYTYHYQSLPAICVADTCTSYILFSCLENKNDTQGIDPISPCTTKSYKVASPQ